MSNVLQSNVQKSKVRTVTLRFEQAAALQHNHADGKEKECDAPPVDIEFFHSHGIEIFNGRM